MIRAARAWIQSAVTISQEGCWVWKRRLTYDGYGLAVMFRKSFGAHRIAYEAWKGEIPDGLHLDHLCHNRDAACPGGRACKHRRCVNPDHLEAVPKLVNDLRGGSFAAVNSRKDHCVNDHPFDAANTYFLTLKSGRTRRQCRRCQAAAVARYQARKKAA